MPLKKIYLPNQCYFVTTNIADRKWVFGELKNGLYAPNDKLCQIIVEVLNFTRDKFNFLLHGFVIMPDHLHLILTIAGDKSPATRGTESNRSKRVGGDSFPPITGDISQIMHAIKGRSARLINKELGKLGRFWQEDFYEHGIRNDQDFEEKLNYIHWNPVKVNLAKEPSDFKYSSYRNYFLNDQSIIEIDIID